MIVHPYLRLTLLRTIPKCIGALTKKSGLLILAPPALYKASHGLISFSVLWRLLASGKRGMTETAKLSGMGQVRVERGLAKHISYGQRLPLNPKP